MIARRGGVVSEDIVVPIDRVEEALEQTLEIGRRHDLIGLVVRPRGRRQPALVLPGRPASSRRSSRRAELAVEDLFDLAVRLGGSVSGEHGLGVLKRGQLARQWGPRALELHEEIKRLFDPKNLLNPGKKLARPIGESLPVATRS